MCYDLGYDINEIVKLIENEIKLLRNKKNEINFIQIGAGVGTETHDIVNQVMLPIDNGILVEPFHENFEKLKKNKPPKVYPNYNLYEFAILPTKFIDLNLKFKVQTNKYVGHPEGNNFLLGETKHGCDFIESECKVISLVEFFHNYVKDNIDCLFVDIEGLDYELIVEYVQNFPKPKILCFEGWEDFAFDQINMQLIKRNETIDILQKCNYKLFRVKDDFLAILQ